MNRKVALMLLLATLIMSTPTIATAKTTTQKIEFRFEAPGYSSKCLTYDPVTELWSWIHASAVLTGNIRDKDGDLYLSPQTGTITIGDVEHQILVKPLKQSEPVSHIGTEIGTPGSSYYRLANEYYQSVEGNIGGEKYTGTIEWFEFYHEQNGQIWEGGWSGLRLRRYLDDGGKVICSLNGGLPEIG